MSDAAPEPDDDARASYGGDLTDPRRPARSSAREAAVVAAAVTAGTALATAFAFDPERAGTPQLLAAIGGVYAVLAAVTLVWLRRRGELRAAMRPRSGDLALGGFVAALLYGLAMAVHLAALRGTAREAWILRVYLQLGDPAAEGRVLVGAAVFVIAALEEIVWRGFVMRALEGPLGPVRALFATGALYALAHLPTISLLADPAAGPNPLIVAAAFGCGLAWARVVQRAGRLVPAIFAHAMFSWAVVSFPLWRP